MDPDPPNSLRESILRDFLVSLLTPFPVLASSLGQVLLNVHTIQRTDEKTEKKMRRRRERERAKKLERPLVYTHSVIHFAFLFIF